VGLGATDVQFQGRALGFAVAEAFKCPMINPCFPGRRFNSGMQQAGINRMAERAMEKAGGVKGLPPEAVGA
jgi:hypothetical protein